MFVIRDREGRGVIRVRGRRSCSWIKIVIRVRGACSWGGIVFVRRERDSWFVFVIRERHRDVFVDKDRGSCS
ncbi:MAG: hypothetical protein JRJ26_15990 [Deltaproteobacteria bacterium]|nr:hypothetical protein [Deltaproteobacteria bacterium]